MGKGIAKNGTAGIKKCAFRKYWYDPTNSAIAPAPGIGMWNYEQGVKKKCSMKNDLQTVSNSTCNKFQCKL